MEKMPALFLGHGSPMNAIVENESTKALAKIGQSLPSPKAILMVSAHWETKGSFVTGMESPKTIHDFYGFPKELYEVEYAASGAPELAEKISSEISEIENEVSEWGLDHGTWSVLTHVFPKADIPVIQLSLDMTKPASYHFEMGKKLAHLREEGIMIMGSGNVVHNLKTIAWGDEAKPHDWAITFNNWVRDKLLAGDFDSLVNKALDSKEGKLSIPTLEHYLPMLYVLGAKFGEDRLEIEYDEIQNSSISMLSFSLN